MPQRPHSEDVLVVDDDRLVSATVRNILESVALRAVCFDSAQEFLTQLPRSQASCVLLDVRMPEMTGLELLQRIQATGFASPIVVMTGYADVDTAVAAFRRGAFDFINKPISASMLIGVVQRAIAQSAESRAIRASRNRLAELEGSLTLREREVLPLLAKGNSNKQIGRILGISPRTAERHRYAIFGKMEVSTIAELVRLVGAGKNA